MLPRPPDLRGIGDWELSGQWRPTRLERTDALDDRASMPSPRGAQHLLDLLAPYLAPVTEALAPLLAAHGLSLTEATLTELLAIEGLTDEVLSAATQAVARVEAIGLHPTDGARQQLGVGVMPAGWGRVASPDRSSDRLLTAERPPALSPTSSLPEGWQAHLESGPRHLMYAEDGEPCYPDAPPFEEFWPKCPPPESTAAPTELPCREDARFVHAEARLRELRHFDRLPSHFRGFDYRAHLTTSVSVPVEDLYRCGEKPGSPHTLASWFGPPGPTVIRLYQRFLDIEFEWDLLGVLVGPVDFRAAVLLHEHVHRIEDPQMGTVSAPPDRDYHPVGSSGQDDCPWSGTEYDAAYLQTLYLGGSEPIARMVADLYGRAQCKRLSRSARLLAAAADLTEVLSLGWLASLNVTAALTVYLLADPDRGMALLSQLLSPDIAALVLLLLLPG